MALLLITGAYTTFEPVHCPGWSLLVTGNTQDKNRQDTSQDCHRGRGGARARTGTQRLSVSYRSFTFWGSGGIPPIFIS